MLSFISDYGMTLGLLPLIILTVFFVHEFGHFLAAFMLGMKVEYVSIGKGKVIYSRTDSHGIAWRLHIFPISAHVHIDDFTTTHRDKFWARLMVVFAGPLANMILPFILLFFFYASFGKPSMHTYITGLQTDLPAYAAGLKPGDQILTINGQEIKASRDVSEFTHNSKAPLTFEIKRGENTLTKIITPDWYQYKDLDGVNRHHGRIGVFMSQRPYAYKMLESINGTKLDKDDNEGKTRLLKEYLGQNIKVEMEANDGIIHHYEVQLPEAANEHLSDPEKAENHIVYFGAIGENFLLKEDIAGSWKMARDEGTKIISDIIKLPFNLFPIDKEWISADANISTDQSYILHYLHFFIYKTALFSVLIGFINLIPIPGMDGSVALVATTEKLRKQSLSNKQKAMLIGGALAILYAAVFITNAPDMHSYYDFKIGSLSEYLSEK